MAQGTRVSPSQLTAGAGLLQGQGIAVSGTLTSAISTLTSITAVGLATSVVNSASSHLSGSTLTTLNTMGATTYPGLTNVVPTASQGTLGSQSFTTALTTHATDILGTDLGVFSQHLSVAIAFATTSNEFISATTNAAALNLGAGMDNLLTGGITDITQALPSFSSDLANTGNLFDFSQLRNLGNPLAFVKRYQQLAGGLTIIDKALTAQGINATGLSSALTLNDPSSLINVPVNSIGTIGLVDESRATPTNTNTNGLGKEVYLALGRIKKDDLASMQLILGSKIPNLTTAQDFLDPHIIIPNVADSLKSFDINGTTLGIYKQKALNGSLNGLGKELYTAIPESIADVNVAVAQSLGQIKQIFNIDSFQLAKVSATLETTKGLGSVNSLTQAIPADVITYYSDTYGVGSGHNGEFLITDVIGTVAGFIHNDELPIVSSDLANIDEAGELDTLASQYTEISNLFAGDYTYTIINPFVLDANGNPTVTYFYVIPVGRPGAGTYDTKNLAADAVLSLIGTEIARIVALYPQQATKSVNSWNNMVNQIVREKENMVKAGIVPADTQTGVKSSIIGMSSNLHDYGKDTSLGGTAYILENVADSSTIYGQSVIMCLREGRNLQRFNDVGIGNSIFVDSITRTTEQATLSTSTYTIDEAKNNL
jgi:hypothetical protein